MQTPGRLVQSVAQASFDAWVKYYRQDENTPNATVSYYTKGALVALCFDLSLRSESGAAVREPGRGDARPVAALQGRPDERSRFRGGAARRSADAPARRKSPPGCTAPASCRWKTCCSATASACCEEPAQLAQGLGLRVQENGGVQIKTVLRGGAAERAGFAAGDEWLGVETLAAGSRKARRRRLAPGQARRLCTLYAGAHKNRSRRWSRATSGCCAWSSPCRRR